MSVLRLAVLGPPEVFHNESRLAFPLRKAQALLLYLAVERGMHSRSKLAALLWPDSEPQVARKALRNALALLRNLLAAPAASPAQHSHLISEGELLGLDPQTPRELDLDVVQRAWNEAQRLTTPPAEEQRAALVTGVQHALALVRGPFLDGFWLGEDAPFDEWVRQQQQQWQVRLQLLCERLSSWQEEAFEQEQAKATLVRWLALDPLAEEAYRRLMRVHLALGDPAAAMPGSTLPAGRAWPRSCGSNRLRTPSPWPSTFAPALRVAEAPLPAPPLPRRKADRKPSWWPRSWDGKPPSATSSGAFSRRAGVSRRPCWWWGRPASAKRGWRASGWPGQPHRARSCSLGKPSRWGDACPTSSWWRLCGHGWRRKTRRRTCWTTCGWPNCHACCRSCGCAIPIYRPPLRMS